MDFPGLSRLGYKYSDLHNPKVLQILTQAFYEDVQAKDPQLHTQFIKYASQTDSVTNPVEVSSLLENMAGHLSAFIASLFGIEKEIEQLKQATLREKVVFECRRNFFTRRVLKKYSADDARRFDRQKLSAMVQAIIHALPDITHDDPEIEAASAIQELLEHERFAKVGLTPLSVTAVRSLADRLASNESVVNLLPSGNDEPQMREFLVNVLIVFEQWLAACWFQNDPVISTWTMLKVPGPWDFDQLVDVERSGDDGHVISGPQEDLRRREGFDLTDERFDARHADGEVDYCIICHKREKDSCSHGFPEGNGYKRNPLGYELKGCPLDQKISESHELKSRGDSLGALATIMIDNPLLPGTGHRICNDCMKGCIFQKQDPVNIPQVETRILTEVLSLPWGFEIYSLLTRWNPLNIRRPAMLAYNGMKILVVGMGPAGYTLAHYLLNEGFGVVGIDGLKIESLSAEYSNPDGSPRPVRDLEELRKKLSERPIAGFGGVSEYGITSRWDKNFLTVIYLTLLRRENFALFDGVRFGGTITIDDAWAYGFDHVCLAAGAGKPTFVKMKNYMIRGIRKASDFLMTLQLTGAGKQESMANLQVRLPAIVIGGGLTAIDTATELMAYYPVQVRRFLERFRELEAAEGRETVLSMFDQEEREAVLEFLHHGEAIEAERVRATSAGESPNYIPLLHQWGGVHLYYRKSLQDSPAYRLNHEEIIKGLEEGFHFVEKMNPVAAVPDQFGALKEMVFEEMEFSDGKWKNTGRLRNAPVRTAIIAAGTVPNVMYEGEHPGTFALDPKQGSFLAHTFEGGKLEPRPGDPGAFFTSYCSPDGRTVTFYGDNHPAYAGSVVKAMASAKNGYRRVVTAVAARRPFAAKNTSPMNGEDWSTFVRTLSKDLAPEVVSVNRLTPTITEIIARAPKAAREFHPGQFYRLQNYEKDSVRTADTLLMMEGIALTGAWVDHRSGEIGMVALEVGASSRISSMLKPGQRIVVMGPTGTPTEIKDKETVILFGGGLGNAVLFSIGRAFRERGGRVLYFAGYKSSSDLFKREWLEAAADVLVYSVDRGAAIPVDRPTDRSTVGNIVQAALAYAKGDLGPTPIRMDEASRVIAIGSDRMMAAVQHARMNELKEYLRPDHIGVASINSPMQCMMKAICAQCLQRHVDPETGIEHFVFSCVNQDQPIDHVDFSNLNARLRQNSVMEKLSARWLEHVLQLSPVGNC